MDLTLFILSTTLIVILLGIYWDTQPVFLRILTQEEHKDCFSYTISALKWPFVFEQKVYRTNTGRWVVPKTTSIFQPILAVSDIQEAYQIWKYENNKS